MLKKKNIYLNFSIFFSSDSAIDALKNDSFLDFFFDSGIDVSAV